MMANILIKAGAEIDVPAPGGFAGTTQPNIRQTRDGDPAGLRAADSKKPAERATKSLDAKRSTNRYGR
jgi:hypothetical protein